MKKLLTLFSTLSITPLLGQLTISCESNDKKELSQILNSINKSLNISEINENELKEWCVNWINYIEKEQQPQKLDNEKLKDIILANLAIYAISHFIEEEAKVKAVIKQLKTDNNIKLDPIFSTLEKISEEKIVKALLFAFLMSNLNKESAFDCEFQQQNENDKRFVLTVKKADWEDIKEETNESFITVKRTILETSTTKLINDLNLPSEIEQKAEKVKKLIKHVTFKDVKNVYDKIVSEKTFTLDFSN